MAHPIGEQEIELADRAKTDDLIRARGRTGVGDRVAPTTDNQPAKRTANELSTGLKNVNAVLKPNAKVTVGNKNFNVVGGTIAITGVQRTGPIVDHFDEEVSSSSEEVDEAWEEQRRKDLAAGEAKRSARTKKIVAGVIAGVLTLAGAAVLSALGALGILGRPGRGKSKDLPKPLPDPPQTVDFDVITENKELIADWTVDVKLSGENGTRVDSLPQTYGAWAVRAADKHILFNLASPAPALPATGGVIEAEYFLVDPQGNIWPSGKLSVNFAPTAAAFTAITGAARTSTPEFDIPKQNPGFLGDVRLLDAQGNAAESVSDSAGQGVWKVDATTKHVAFTPALLPNKGASVSVSYVLVLNGVASKPQPLKIDFADATATQATPPPPATITAITGAARTSTPDFDILGNNPGFQGDVKLLDANNNPVYSVIDPTGQGEWKVNATTKHVTFTPAVLPDKGASVTVPYVLVLNGVASTTSQPLKIDFVDAAPNMPPVKPTAIPIKVTGTPSPVDIDVPGKNMNFPGDVKLIDGTTQVTSLKDTATGGTWTVDANRHIQFTYTMPITMPSAKVRYVLVLNDSQKTASDSQTLEIDFSTVAVPPAKPADQALPGSRTQPTTFNPGPTMPGDQIRLVNGVSRVSTLPTAAGVWDVQLDGSITFNPAMPCKPSTDTVQFVIVRGGLESPAATLKLTFPRKPEAYVCSATSMDRNALFKLEFLNCSVVPDGFASITLYGDMTVTLGQKQSLITILGTWNVMGQPDRVEFQLIAPLTTTEATIYYEVTDVNGVNSNRAKMTIAIVKPKAQHFLLAQGVGAGKMLTADVLADSVSQFPKDRKSVILLGLLDIGRDTVPDGAFLRDDGKAMNVPDEGNWLVDDTGLIVFQADAGFDDAPTPVSYCFSDVKGTQSTAGMILVDPSLGELTPFLKALGSQSDHDFWAAFHKNTVDDPKIPLTASEMVAITQTYAVALRRLVPSELICPVSDADYNKGYKKWSGGQGNDDLIKICTALATTATHKNPNPLTARYWALTLMVRMLLEAGI